MAPLLIVLVVVVTPIALVVWDLHRIKRKAKEQSLRRDRPFPTYPRRSGQAADGTWVSDITNIGIGDGGHGDGGFGDGGDGGH